MVKSIQYARISRDGNRFFITDPGDSDAGCPISEIGGEKVTLEKACGMGLPEL